MTRYCAGGFGLPIHNRGRRNGVRQTAAPGHALEGPQGHLFAEFGARMAEISIWRTQIVNKRRLNPLQGMCPCGSLAKGLDFHESDGASPSTKHPHLLSPIKATRLVVDGLRVAWRYARARCSKNGIL